MTYTVWYKKPNGFIWHKIKEVEGDTYYEIKEGALPVRVFFLKNKERVEIPMSFLFRFSKERFFDIHEKMEKEAGIKIPI